MIIDDGVFRQEFNTIPANSQNAVFYNYLFSFFDEFHNEIKAHNVSFIKIQADYVSAMFDIMFVNLGMIKTDYLKLLTVNRKLLTGQLVKLQTDYSGNPVIGGNTIISQYVAHLPDLKSEAIETRSGGLTNQQSDNLGEIVDVKVQLIQQGLMEYRLWESVGNYRNVALDALLQGLMSQPLQTLTNTKNNAYRVSMAPIDNVNRIYQLTIPNNVKLIDLPGWLQVKRGIYSAGIAYYLTNSTWYVFPPYDITRYKKLTKRLTIINVPPNEAAGLTNSYTVKDSELYIYATGGTAHIDHAEKHLDKSGTAIRVAKMGNVYNNFVDNTKGQAVIPPNQNSAIIGFDKRSGDMTNIKTPETLFTTNVWNDASNVISKMGNHIIVNWEHSNTNLIYPGMPIKFIYKNSGIAYSLYGVLIRCDTDISTHLESVTDTRYQSNSTLTLFVERAIN